MKTLALIIICLFPIFAYAKDYRSLDTSDGFSIVAPTGPIGCDDDYVEAVKAIKDPTARMLNHTFWCITTVAEIKQLIKAGADLSARVDVPKYGLRILDFAIFSGKREFVQAVLNSSPNTNYISGSNNDGHIFAPYTPLMLAAMIFPDDRTMMKRIVELGCDPNALSDHWTALTYAEHYHASLEVRKYLLSVMSPTLRLHSATFWRSVTAADVRREIKNGADINYWINIVPFSSGEISPLWYALQYSKDFAAIQLLIDAGAKISSLSPDDPMYVDRGVAGFDNKCELLSEDMQAFIQKTS